MLGNEVHDLLQQFVEILVGQQDLAGRLEQSDVRQLGGAFEECWSRIAGAEVDGRSLVAARLVEVIGQFAEVDAVDDRERCGGDELRKAEFQNYRGRGTGCQLDPITIGEPLPGNPLAVHGNSATQLVDGPALGVAYDFGVIAFDQRV